MRRQTKRADTRPPAIGRGGEFLVALNAAAASLQRVAHSEAEVIRAFREQIADLDLRGGLSLLDETGERLVFRGVTYPGPISRMIAELENLTGITTEGFTISVAQVDAYRQVLESRQAVFAADSAAAIMQILPQAARRLAGPLLKVFGRLPSLYAPLNTTGKAFGVLTVTGAGLIPDDLPAIQAFANHIAVALENARIVAALDVSEQKFRGLVEQSLDGIVLVDENGNIVEWNRGEEHITGIKAEEALGRPLWDVQIQVTPAERRTPELHAQMKAMLQAYFATGQAVWLNRQSEREIVRTDGQIRTVQSIAYPIRFGSHSLIGTIDRDITERRRAEEALRESERLLKQSQAIAGVGSYVLDIATGRWTSSALLDDLFGIDEQYVRSVEGWAALVHPEWRELMVNYFANEVLGKHTRFDKEYKIVRNKNGEERWVHGLGELEFDARGQPIRMIGTIVDITERKRRERELESIALVSTSLRAAPDYASMMPIIVNQIFRVLVANTAALVRREPATGELIVSLARGRLEDMVGSRLPRDNPISQHVIHTGRPYVTDDARMFQPADGGDGRAAAAACVPLISQGNALGALWVGREAPFTPDEVRLLAAIADITASALQRARLTDTLEQRILERTAELARERAQMQAVLDSAGEGVILTDADERILYINPAMTLLTGYTPAEALGQTPRLWRSNRTPRAAQDDMRHASRTAQSWRGEIVLRPKNGPERDITLTITPLIDTDGGGAIGFVGIYHDITRLKELDRLKSKFVSDVSHELRTPVANLKLYVDLLENGKPEKRAHYMQVLKDQADRQVQLVEDILNLSRLEIGADKVQFAPVDLNALIQQVVDAHQPMAEAAGLKLILAPEPDLPPVRGERNQLAQVITNLVVNAINYTLEGNVRVITRRCDGQMCLEVRDTGQGIDPQDMPHLFDRFYRGKRARAVPGTGLGLSIVKEIVDLHGGTIAVHSEVGEGTSITIALPPEPSTIEETRETNSRNRG